MAREITEQDLANKGVSGLPDVPGLTTEAMQKKFDEISRELLVPRFNEMAKEVNEVNENLTELNSDLEKNNLVTSVDLTPYTSSENSYVADTDGYVYMMNNTAIAGAFYVESAENSRGVMCGGVLGLYTSLYVKKGMRVYMGETIPTKCYFMLLG